MDASGRESVHKLNCGEKYAVENVSSLLLIFGCLSGCASIGPATLARDRFDYTTAISHSGKRRCFFNVVKLRYADAPVFLMWLR